MLVYTSLGLRSRLNRAPPAAGCIPGRCSVRVRGLCMIPSAVPPDVSHMGCRATRLDQTKQLGRCHRDMRGGRSADGRARRRGAEPSERRRTCRTCEVFIPSRWSVLVGVRVRPVNMRRLAARATTSTVAAGGRTRHRMRSRARDLLDISPSGRCISPVLCVAAASCSIGQPVLHRLHAPPDSRCCR